MPTSEPLDGARRGHRELIYGIDDKPPLIETITLGLQHYLIMFGATFLIPIILSEPLGIRDGGDLARLIGTMFLVSGITTLLQTTFGNRLPIVQGGTFSFIQPAIAICAMAGLAEAGWEVRMQHIQGAVIVGGVVEVVAGYTGLVGRLLRFISPVVIAPTIALIGLSLFQLGAPKAGKDWVIGGLTIVLIIGFSQYLRSVHRVFRLFPVMLAIFLAWGLAAVLSAADVFPAGHASHVSLDAVARAPWVEIPYPFQWGLPSFGVAAIVGMLAGYLASMIESIGDYYACARLSGAPVPDAKVIDRGIGMEGLGCVVAGIFGTGNGTTSYSENIGAIGITRVGSRRVVQAGAVLMIVLAVVGKFSAVFTTIPEPVIGGIYCTMFGMIAAVGLSNLQFVDLDSTRNLFILGFSFFMGLSVPVYFDAHPITLDPGRPDWLHSATLTVNIIGKTGMAVGALVATILDNTIPGTREERGLTAWLKGR